MRLALLATASLLATLAFAAGADAKPITIGDCSKSGACAGACIGPADCGAGKLACAGVSYQVPQCVRDPGLTTTDPALPCSVGGTLEPLDVVLRCGITVCHVNLDDVIRCAF